jgi:dTDP-glucose 4,6-dehydratase
MKDQKRILVTGAGGFLGRHLVGELTREGHQVVAVTSQPEETLRATWNHSTPEHRDNLVEVVGTGNVFDYPMIDIDVVVNAGFARVQQGAELAKGMDFQYQLLRTLGEARVGRVINISSQSVYDPTRTIVAQETDQPSLTNPYATAKYAQELLAEAFLRTSELLHIRLASLIGVGFDQRLVNKMVTRARETQTISVVGGAQIFDFMDVRDAARAVALLCSVQLTQSPEVVNVGAGQPHSLLEIAECVVAVFREERGLHVELDYVSSESPIVSSELDCSRLSSIYEFQSSFSLRDTVRELVSRA